VSTPRDRDRGTQVPGALLAVAVLGWAVTLLGGAVAAEPSVPLPYQSTDRHLGVASCASSVCHGAVQPPNKPGPLMNEFVTWSHQDSHGKAFQSLLGPQGRSIAAKLKIGPAESAKICLDCHADNVPQARRAKTFLLTDGIGCEACHGGAERWISSHTSSRSNYRQNIRDGMYPTADLNDRAALCLSCHFGTSDKFATHAIMAAGHPRLSFELDTFLALQPVHYRIDDNYRRRKPSFTDSQVWIRGQLLAAQAELLALQGPMITASHTFPELALFNCTSCHDASMHRLEWRPRQLIGDMRPGTVPVNDASLRMSWMIARTMSDADGARIQNLAQALQQSVGGDPRQIAAASGQLRSALSEVLAKVGDERATLRPRALLDSILQAGIEGEYRDYLGAEQAVMAMDLLMNEAKLAGSNKVQLDELYRLLKSDETYRSADFMAALKVLREGLK
jgi:cytochrome c554/c'-like protein